MRLYYKKNHKSQFIIGFIRIKNDGRYGFIDTNGNLVGNEIKWFDNAKDFNENGLALCELNGNTYTLDSKGELHRIEQ